MRILTASWRTFRQVMERVGNFQARVLLTVFYLVIAAPFGLGVRLRSDPLRQRRGAGGRTWLAREPRAQDLDAARRQY